MAEVIGPPAARPDRRRGHRARVRWRVHRRAVRPRHRARRARRTIAAAWDAGVRYFDTAPWYGRGLSELRTGRRAARPPARASTRCRPRSAADAPAVGRPPDFDRAPWLGGLPNEVIFDYTYDGIMRSVEQQPAAARHHPLRRRLHPRPRPPVLRSSRRSRATCATSPSPAGGPSTSCARAARSGRSGPGINERGLIPRLLAIGDIDAFLIAMPYTLLHQEVLDDEFPAAVERGRRLRHRRAVPVGHPGQGRRGRRELQLRAGAARGRGAGSRRIQAVCERHGVPLAAAALQFPLGHPAVASVIPGASLAGPAGPQPRGVPPPDPGRPVGRAQARGPAPRRRPVPA